MRYRYAVLGAGRQGTAAAYDLAVRGDAAAVVVADASPEAAASAAARVDAMAGRQVAEAAVVDLADTGAVAELLGPVDAALTAASYTLNLGVTEAAIAAGTPVCDLGGHPGVVAAQLALDADAREAGVAVVPDCGQVPGTGANLMAWVAARLDEPESVVLYDGGIPEAPRPPWHYLLTFSVDGLTNEYDGVVTWQVGGRRVEVPVFAEDEHELVPFPPFGTLEAFPTNGGTSTVLDTLGGRVPTLKNKTLRYPGHAAQFRAFRDLGLFGQEPVGVGGVEVRPRDVFHALLEPQLAPAPGDRDVVLNRVVGTGAIGRVPARVVLDVVVRPDDRLGLTAMQQATGWHAAIVCHRLADGSVPAGVTPVEIAVDPDGMLAELRARGFQVTERCEVLGG